MSVEEGAVPIRTQMICLAFWMKDRYAFHDEPGVKDGPPREGESDAQGGRVIVSLKTREEIETLLIEAEKKKFRARVRLYRALLENAELPLKLTSEKLGVTSATLKPLVEKRSSN